MGMAQPPEYHNFSKEFLNDLFQRNRRSPFTLDELKLIEDALYLAAACATERAQPHAMVELGERVHQMREGDEKLPCGHHINYAVRWKEDRDYARVSVEFCLACNYESVTKKLEEAKK